MLEHPDILPHVHKPFCAAPTALNNLKPLTQSSRAWAKLFRPSGCLTTTSFGPPDPQQLLVRIPVLHYQHGLQNRSRDACASAAHHRA